MRMNVVDQDNQNGFFYLEFIKFQLNRDLLLVVRNLIHGVIKSDMDKWYFFLYRPKIDKNKKLSRLREKKIKFPQYY